VRCGGAEVEELAKKSGKKTCHPSHPPAHLLKAEREDRGDSPACVARGAVATGNGSFDD